MAKSFEELKIWQQARELTNIVYKLTGQNKFLKDNSLNNQMRRAAVSIMANIAEGFERGGNTEFIQFLYIAKSSCGELRSHFVVALDQQYITDADYNLSREKAAGLSAMISNMITYLKKSKIKGEKYL